MRQAVDRYLAMRQAAGFDLVNAAYLLRSFARAAAERGETHVRAATAIEWASRGPSVAQRDARLKTICRFARYVQPEDGRHDVPPGKHFGTHKNRRVPHIYSRSEITRLIDAARQLGPPEGVHPHTYATLIALLAATGLRISEALSLQLADVTPRGLMIRKTKFQKTRLVPLHDTTQAGLDRYLTSRRQVMSNGEHVFVTDDGRPLRYREVYPTFQTLVKLAGLGVVSGHRLRLHELRHSSGRRIIPSSAGWTQEFPGGSRTRGDLAGGIIKARSGTPRPRSQERLGGRRHDRPNGEPASRRRARVASMSTSCLSLRSRSSVVSRWGMVPSSQETADDDT